MSGLVIAVSCLVVLVTAAVEGNEPRKEAVVKEYDRTFTTYPYSDPDPIAAMAEFYPYFRFDGYLKGKEVSRQRKYGKAAEAFRSCLKKEPGFLPALVEMASLANRRADSAAARDLAQQALSIDTYDPGANYEFGVASAALGRNVDAIDAFSVAALSTECRSAALTELARVYLREKRYDRALNCAENSLDYNRRNLDAIQLRACIHRLRTYAAGAETALTSLLELDPLNHFAHFEKYLSSKMRCEEFTGLIRNELPYETYLELAAWYRGVGVEKDAVTLLDLAPPTAEVLYWLAYLRQDASMLACAETASPMLVFPFRSESIPVFQWASEKSQAWQPKYYLALIRWHHGELGQARELLTTCEDAPPYGPFYAVRAQVAEENAVHDLQRAAQLDPDQWRYGVMLAKHHLKQGDRTAALDVTAEYVMRFPDNGAFGLLHAKALLLNGRYQTAVERLASLRLFPCEDAIEARALFQEAHLILALERMKAGSFDEALRLIDTARQWPENLGAGQPYPDVADERLEDWLAYDCHRKSKSLELSRRMIDKILAFRPNDRRKGVGEIIRALVLRQSARADEGRQLVTDWLKQDPADKIAQWGDNVLAGRIVPMPAELDDSGCRVLAAWLQSEDEHVAK